MISAFRNHINGIIDLGNYNTILRIALKTYPLRIIISHRYLQFNSNSFNITLIILTITLSPVIPNALPHNLAIAYKWKISSFPLPISVSTKKSICFISVAAVGSERVGICGAAWGSLHSKDFAVRQSSILCFFCFFCCCCCCSSSIFVLFFVGIF